MFCILRICKFYTSHVCKSEHNTYPLHEQKKLLSYNILCIREKLYFHDSIIKTMISVNEMRIRIDNIHATMLWWQKW